MREENKEDKESGISAVKQEKLERLAADSAAQMDVASRLQKEKGIDFVSAYVMAGDLVTAERAAAALQRGEVWQKWLWRVGSYARMQWAMKHLPHTELIKLLPEIWVSSDPDDTDPDYLELWKAARAAKGSMVTDGEEIFVTREGILTVYRGQVGEELGISWTTDPRIAEKFSRSGGLRATQHGGRVIKGTVRRGDILAYLTRRDESEIIVDPVTVEII
jgi:hypothetical protein